MKLLIPDPDDLATLLALDPADRLGRIIRLNRQPRYANRLDAKRMLELLCGFGSREHTGCVVASDSSPSFPGPSESGPRRPMASARFGTNRKE